MTGQGDGEAKTKPPVRTGDGNEVPAGTSWAQFRLAANLQDPLYKRSAGPLLVFAEADPMDARLPVAGCVVSVLGSIGKDRVRVIAPACGRWSAAYGSHHELGRVWWAQPAHDGEALSEPVYAPDDDPRVKVPYASVQIIGHARHLAFMRFCLDAVAAELAGPESESESERRSPDSPEWAKREAREREAERERRKADGSRSPAMAASGLGSVQ